MQEEPRREYAELLREIYPLLALPQDADILCYTPAEVERMRKRDS
jgi:hypothetical protein